MPRFVFTLIAVLVLASAALAVDLPEDLGFGVIGIFTAPEATPESDNFLEGVVTGIPYEFHFTMYHHRLPTYKLGGFECQWRIEPADLDYQVVDVEFAREDAVNFGDYQNLMVGYQIREITYDVPIHLFTATVIFNEIPSNAAIYLEPSTLESIPGEMAYADYLRPDELQIMKPNSAGQVFSEPVFLLNNTVQVEYTSMSSVKALFR